MYPQDTLSALTVFLYILIISISYKLWRHDMKRDMDKIIFESRVEIDEVTDALTTFLKEHPNAKGRNTLERLSDLLDAMYMEW